MKNECKVYVRRTKAQRMYEMVILATGFGEFQLEFPALLDIWDIQFEFCRTFLSGKSRREKCGKIQIHRTL